MKEISLRPADGASAVPSKNVRGARRVPTAKRQLTRREKEILRFLALGMGTSAISRELAISPATVRNHAQRILAKLQVHSRLAAVARGYEVGLLPSLAWRSVVPASSAETPAV
jgi:DNA-binding NarL/FixJ family response regulator